MSALNDLAPVERNSLSDRVYQDLRRLLMSGRLLPGDKLSLREVAKALGVSVMPVRDAVNRLVTEQALLPAPNRGYYVPHMTPEEFRELADIRMEIEGYAGSQAVLRHTPEDLDEIRAEELRYHLLCHTIQPDTAEAVSSNMRFHFLVYAAARMPRLLSIIEALWLRAGPIIFLETGLIPERLVTGRSFLRHAEMVTALETGDTALMRAAIAGDIGTTAEYILNSNSLTLNRHPQHG